MVLCLNLNLEKLLSFEKWSQYFQNTIIDDIMTKWKYCKKSIFDKTQRNILIFYGPLSEKRFRHAHIFKRWLKYFQNIVKILLLRLQ